MNVLVIGKLMRDVTLDELEGTGTTFLAKLNECLPPDLQPFTGTMTGYGIIAHYRGLPSNVRVILEAIPIADKETWSMVQAHIDYVTLKRDTEQQKDALAGKLLYWCLVIILFVIVSLATGSYLITLVNHHEKPVSFIFGLIMELTEAIHAINKQ